MQNSGFRYDAPAFQKPPTQRVAVYQPALRPPPPFPAKGGMDIGGLLNARNAAAADAELRRQLQQSMQMDGGVAYGMSHGPGPTLAHHQHQHQHQQHPMHHGSMFGGMGPSHNPQLYAQSYIPRHDAQGAMAADDNFGAMRPKNEGAPKAFACSTCQKGFARRSDLARHGEYRTLRSTLDAAACR